MPSNPNLPQPNRYLYFAPADKTFDGRFEVGNYSSQYDAIYDSVDNQNDSLAQLGDVGFDTFVSASGRSFQYVGRSNAGGGGFIARYPNAYGNYYYFSEGIADPQTISVTNDPFTLACFVTGTLIRTTRGDVAVEALAIGDTVVTASGAERPVKWIGHRAYEGRFANANPQALPVCFRAGSLGAGVPARDLSVSPNHAMFVEGVLIEARHLVNGLNVTQAERVDRVEYWHVELESHDVLLAEGAPSESFVDDHSRAMFHNAAAFADLYPEAGRPPAVYCAPRVETGYEFEAARRAILARAGVSYARPAFGDLVGAVDVVGTTLAGWAQDLAHPDSPVCLDIVVDGQVIAQIYADRFRADLERSGIGNGRHGFAVDLPGAPGATIEVSRSGDGVRLPATRVKMARAA